MKNLRDKWKFVEEKLSNKKKTVWLIAGSLGIILLISFIFFRSQWVLKINDQVVTEEEYTFYQKMNPRLNEQALQAQIIEDKVQLQQANKLGIPGIETYKQLSKELKKTNEENEKKIEAGQVIYGLKKYDEESFYSYSLSNTVNKIKEKMREEISDSAIENYYEEHTEQFRTVDTKKLYRVQASKQELQGLTEKDLDVEQAKSAADLIIEETTLSETTLRDWIKYREDEFSSVATLKAKSWSELFGREDKTWGYYCVDTQEGTIPPLESVAESIKIQLEKENYQKQLEKWVEEAEVERK